MHSLLIRNLIESRLSEIISLRGDVRKKEDGSYVSEGDLLVQSLIVDYFWGNLPRHKIISEELAPFEGVSWLEGDSYVVLDPIDGTENFVSGLKEWGIGISIYTDGIHQESMIFLPELNEFLATGMPLKKFKSRIIGLSSSLKKEDLQSLPLGDFEFRIIGCSMYNTLSAVRGAFARFENVKGVNCWDILPGLNLALEHGCGVWVDDVPYRGEILFPVKKYKIRISNLEN